MSKATLRNNDGNPHLYLEGATGSTAIGVDTTNNDQVNLITSDSVTDLDPTSGSVSISVQSTTPGNITLSPKGSGETIINNGDLAIQGNGGTSGNLLMNDTAAAGLSGVIEFGGNRFVHNFGTDNTFIGENAGNFNVGIGAENTAVGASALNALTTGIRNVAIGDGALSSATTEGGAVAIGFDALSSMTASLNGNTAIGFQALKASTVDHYNTAIGFDALAALNGGSTNTAVGGSALMVSTADTNNTALGYATLAACNGGEQNTAVGSGAGIDLTTGDNNTAVGEAAMSLLTTGGNNTIVGRAALFSGLTSSNNIIIGNAAASTYIAAESSNIVIGNAGTLGDNNKIIIGTQGAGAGQQNTCFIAGINGTSVTAAGTVVVSSSGQLGTVASSFPFTWSVITVNQTAVVNNGYICNKAGTLALLLPATAAVGSLLEVTGINTALGWQITQAAGQQIFFGTSSTTLGAGGSLTSSATRDSIRLVCVVADTTWNVISSIGNITVV